MKNLLSPKWLLIAHALPVAVLLFILWGDYNVIKTLLSESSLILWRNFSISLVVILLVNLGYGGYLISAKKHISKLYAFLSLFVYTVFLYFYIYNYGDIMPFSVPRWMVSGDAVVYTVTFIMPALAHSLLALVAAFTPSPATKKAWVNLLIAVLTPFFVYYVFIGAFFKLIDSVLGDGGTHIFILAFIAFNFLFLFFLLRGIYIIASKKSKNWKNYELVWKIPFTLIFPLMGLLTNNGFLFAMEEFFSAGIFGDFFSPWFYILLLLTGILLCMPDLKNKTYRIVLFVGRCITFAYTLYIFIVFLPYLPLSTLAILLLGLGFLLLTPVITMLIHINQLAKDFGYLKTFMPKVNVRLIAAAGFMLIPLCITVSFVNDRLVLNRALDYVYEPNYNRQYNINKKDFSKVLHTIEKNKSTSDFFLFTNTIPYISSYYNWIVMDNLTLSDEKIRNLWSIFYGTGYGGSEEQEEQSPEVKITQTQVETSFDETTRTYRSWVHLDIENMANRSLEEFATTFELPTGCWISDYYLYVEDRKEMGILSEKKTAMWVFSQIQDENKDPGILHYSGGNRIVFKIFPFAQDEVRKTGIEFIHKEPVSFMLAGQPIALGTNISASGLSFKEEAGGMTYLSASYKKNLNEVYRKPYFHFMLDNSVNNESDIKKQVNLIDDLMKQYPNLAANAKVSLVSDVVETFEAGSNEWKNTLEAKGQRGGFFLDRAIKLTLSNSYESDSYPVIVAVSEGLYNAVMDENYRDYQFMFPESDYFYMMNTEGILSKHSLINRPKEIKADTVTLTPAYSVLEYKTAEGKLHYLRNDSLPAIVMGKDIVKIASSDIKEKDFATAMMLQGHWMSQILHPEISGKEWVKLADYSFKSRIMTPVTSYIVVENDAQKEALRRKQEQVLVSERSFDIGGASSASEPDLFILLALLVIILWLKRRKNDLDNYCGQI